MAYVSVPEAVNRAFVEAIRRALVEAATRLLDEYAKNIKTEEFPSRPSLEPEAAHAKQPTPEPSSKSVTPERTIRFDEPEAERSRFQNIYFSDRNLKTQAYVELLKEYNCPHLIALGVSCIVLGHGRRRELESKDESKVWAAIRFLAKGPKQKRSIVSHARVILETARKSTLIETIFSERGLKESEFKRLLDSAETNFNEPDRRRIVEIAQELIRIMRPKRGAKTTAQSAAHEFVLEHEEEWTFGRTPPSGDKRRKARLVRLAEATRQAFDLDEFDYRPALRRVRARTRPN